MAIKFIENGSFVHTKIICSCNYIKSEFVIIDFFLKSRFWMQLLSKDGSLKDLFQKHCSAQIDWVDLWV